MAEIITYKEMVGEVIFRISERLCHIKEKDLVHGQWERWYRGDKYDSPTRKQIHRAFWRFGKRMSTFGIGVDMLALLVDEAYASWSLPVVRSHSKR